MLRKVLLPAAVSLVLAVFAGHGSFTGGVAHAISLQPGCSEGTYTPSSPGPYELDFCLVGENDGTAPDTDDTGYQNWVGTQSFASLGCYAASITNGDPYYNPTGWTELDTYNAFTGEYTVHAHCTVQTRDTGLTHNLFAYIYESECDLQLFNDYPLFGSGTSMATGQGFYGSSQLYEAESPAGAVTLYCNATFYQNNW